MCAFHPFVSAVSHDDDQDMHNDALFSSKIHTQTHKTVALFFARFLSPNLGAAAALLLVLVLSGRVCSSLSLF